MCVWERARDYSPIYNFLPTPFSTPPPPKANLPKKQGEMEKRWNSACGIYLRDISLMFPWSWESWMGSELHYQNLQHWMRQREDSLARAVDRQGPHCSSVSLTHCFLSRTCFLNRPTAYSFCAQRRKHTEHLLDNTLSYVSNCPQPSKAR